MYDSKCSKLLKSEVICVQRDYTEIQRVALYKINATESRDVGLESDHTFIVNTKATQNMYSNIAIVYDHK